MIPILGLTPSLLRADEKTPAPATRAAALARKTPIGLELYSVRTELARDLPNTLKEIAGMGYEYVEFYAPYFEWTLPYAQEVRARMNDVGLRCHSTHNHFETFADEASLTKAMALNQALGAQQLILATAPKGTASAEDWKKLSAQLTTAVARLQTEGLTAGFHNHQTEWKPLDGSQRVMDILAANTPAAFVLQLDVGTCVEAGADPVAWIRAHPGRIKSLHLKDWAPPSQPPPHGYEVLFGEGVVPWASIIQAAEEVGGVELFLMEQEGSRFSEFDTARRCLETWKKDFGRT